MPSLKSWLSIPASSHFSLANLPFGVITAPGFRTPHIAVAIGDQVLDLNEFSLHGGFDPLPEIHAHLAVFGAAVLNDFAALGRPLHRAVRAYLQDVLAEDTSFPAVLKENENLQARVLLPRHDVTNVLPMRIWEYTDFFAGQHHAYNCGVIFRGAQNALQPNYMHLPVGYASRASSVVVSGTPVRRPAGQILENAAADPKIPIFAPCRRLDIELELGAFICTSNPMGDPIPVNEAAEHIFGFVLLNDWSARDIQQWEAIPLGPFNAKNFATSISPWVVLADAMEPFRAPGLAHSHELLPYLQEAQTHRVFDIKLEVDLTTSAGRTSTVSRTNGRYLLYSFAQMIAHHTIGGCPMQVGDLLGSGTISGPEPGTLGSFLEQTKGGKEVVTLESGEERKFLEDGDRITLRGWCGDGEHLVGFGECEGTILPSKF